MAPLSTTLTALLLSTTAIAFNNPFKRQTATPTTSADISQSSCRGVVTTYLGAPFCCPGSFQNTSSDSPFGSAYCCVGGVFSLPISAFSDRFTRTLPTSSTDALTRRQVTSSTTPTTCRSTIYLTDTAYSSKVNANGASATFSMGFTGPVSSEMTATTTSSAATTILSGSRTTTTSASGGITLAPGSGGVVTSSGSTASTGSTATTGAATTSSSGSGAWSTQAPIYGAVVLAAGGLVVAAL